MMAGHRLATAPAHALIVDDEPVVRLILTHLLTTRLRCRATAVSSGDEALPVLDTDRPDLLVVDDTLPGMNGLDVAREARRRLPTLPLVLIPAILDQQDIRQLRQEGLIYASVRKPFDAERLLEMLDVTLAKWPRDRRFPHATE